MAITSAAALRSAGQARLPRLGAELSNILGADLTAAILELTQAKTHQQAALEARAKMPNSSLFDVLG